MKISGPFRGPLKKLVRRDRIKWVVGHLVNCCLTCLGGEGRGVFADKPGGLRRWRHQNPLSLNGAFRALCPTYVRGMCASSRVKLIEEELFYVFGAEAGGLTEVVDGDEVAAGFAEGGADAAE